MEYFDCGKRLRALQDAMEISSVDMAKRIGCTPQQLVRWRQQSNLKAHTVQAVCDALDVHLSDFFNNDWMPWPPD
jgi:transcriptional regulator with XRE-family HTH domain